ncbi:hypothetical protein BU16DRAFT_505930 [Lophium mytilinum]|uniref:Integral membrane protein n=1 Tax=Lophium mytilinum TaxID=390894 RepID=A0A6A6R299_9PEZI|nr:hypothetical protein BU16DRAFT_505930 [Lophium mytilinum]
MAASTSSTSSPPAIGKPKETHPFLLSPSAFAKFAAICGPLAIVFFFIMLPAASFLPPISPHRSAEAVAHHYQRHETGLKGGIALMTFVGFFFPMYTSAIGGQMSRIPGVPTTVLNAQLLGGCLGGLFLTLPAYFFATGVYRTDRAPELIQLLNDLSWIFFAMPFASLLCQDLAFSWAVLLDRREKPLYPRWLAFLTTALTLCFWPALGVHCVKSGAIAWNGGLAFWTAGVGGGAQICIISLMTFLAAGRTDLPSEVDVREGAFLGEGASSGRFVTRVEVERLVERLVAERTKGVKEEN